MQLHDKIKDLLAEIARLPAAQNIVVFGSVAKSAEVPGDLDVALRLEECKDWSAALEAQQPTIARLRQLSARFYGWLDPFVVTKSDLVVRNDEATGWKMARNAKALRSAIARDGVPILDLARRHALAPMPPFLPRIYRENGEEFYADGSVLGAVDTAEFDGRRSICISEWSSYFPGNGHTVRALKWMRAEGFEHITANSVGLSDDEGDDISVGYWKHIHSLGLVDTLLDDNAMDITPAERSSALPRP